jgi:hypothetical protein
MIEAAPGACLDRLGTERERPFLHRYIYRCIEASSSIIEALATCLITDT